MKHDIFISYSSKDSYFVDELVDALEGIGLNCWCAHRIIPAGESWSPYIAQELPSSSVVMLIYSEHSAASEQVVKEILLAGEVKKTIIPIKINDSGEKDLLKLEIIHLHYLNIIGEASDVAIQKIISQLKPYEHLFPHSQLKEISAATKGRYISAAPTISQKKEQPIKAQKKSSRLPMFLGLICVLCIGILGAIQMFKPASNLQNVSKEQMPVETSSTSSKLNAESTIKKTDSKKIDLAGIYEQSLKLLNEQSFDDAIAKLEQLVELNYPEAEVQLANLYYNGVGVEINKSKAVALYQRAASKGSAEAQYSLAYMYEQGISVSKNIDEAISLYKQAAQNGFSDAMYSLGEIYEYGVAGAFDEKKSFQYYFDAAKAGLATAQFKVGIMYYDGFGIEQNQAEGLSWLHKAADAGNDEAKIFLSAH